jgi:predicted lipoprotein with Yx(FWY)xxD motif
MLPSVAALSLALTPAQASPSAPTTGLAIRVVHEVNRAPVGPMLANNKGRSLYILSSGSCTGGCLTVWPPLLMPKGYTIPKGIKCLSTTPFGTNGRLQVTYDGKALYKFSGDTGTSLNGNGLGGFFAATIVAPNCT